MSVEDRRFFMRIAVRCPYCGEVVVIDTECLDCSCPHCGKSFSPREARLVKTSPRKKRKLLEAKGFRSEKKNSLALYWTVTVLSLLVGFLSIFVLTWDLYR
jgi:hypothetical protein